jgi:hypothetical protein
MSPWHRVSDEWKPRLRAYLLKTCGEDRERLSAYDFRSDQHVSVTFEDQSHALFHYAFALFDESGERCMIFTEHCGYHIFPVGREGVSTWRTVNDEQENE